MYKGNAQKQNNDKEITQESQNITRSLRELQLEEPIRYAMNDPVEEWLTQTLCLDATKIEYR